METRTGSEETLLILWRARGKIGTVLRLYFTIDEPIVTLWSISVL